MSDPNGPVSRRVAVVSRIGSTLAKGLGRVDRMTSRRPRLLCATLIVLVTALGVGSGVLWHQHLRLEAVAQARKDAVPAARENLIAALSYDYRSLDGDVAKAEGGLVHPLLDQFSQLMRTVVVPAAREQQIVTHATVVRTAVVDAAPDRVVVLAFVNQSTTSTRLEGQQINGSRVRVTMVARDGRWLISEMTSV